jgi:pilus assembly protein Flp/PilA
MKDLIQRFWSDDSGQGLAEYALILGLVAVGLVLVLTAFRNEIGNVINSVTLELRNAPGNPVAAP